MDNWFDRLTKAIAGSATPLTGSVSRRDALRGQGAGVAGGFMASLGLAKQALGKDKGDDDSQGDDQGDSDANCNKFCRANFPNDDLKDCKKACKACGRTPKLCKVPGDGF